MWTRLVLVAAVIFLPLATGEILDNNVNIGWWFFFAAFWALLSRPRTPLAPFSPASSARWPSGTEPLVALFLPLAPPGCSSSRPTFVRRHR